MCILPNTPRELIIQTIRECNGDDDLAILTLLNTPTTSTSQTHAQTDEDDFVMIESDNGGVSECVVDDNEWTLMTNSTMNNSNNNDTNNNKSNTKKKNKNRESDEEERGESDSGDYCSDGDDGDNEGDQQPLYFEEEQLGVCLCVVC